jgi:hypothetical protein
MSPSDWTDIPSRTQTACLFVRPCCLATHQSCPQGLTDSECLLLRGAAALARSALCGFLVRTAVGNLTVRALAHCDHFASGVAMLLGTVKRDLTQRYRSGTPVGVAAADALCSRLNVPLIHLAAPRPCPWDNRERCQSIAHDGLGVNTYKLRAPSRAPKSEFSSYHLSLARANHWMIRPQQRRAVGHIGTRAR